MSDDDIWDPVHGRCRDAVRPSGRSRTGDDGAIIAACLGLSNGFVLAHGNEPPGLAQRCHTPATQSNACSRRSRLCARRSIRG